MRRPNAVQAQCSHWPHGDRRIQSMPARRCRCVSSLMRFPLRSTATTYPSTCSAEIGASEKVKVSPWVTMVVAPLLPRMICTTRWATKRPPLGRQRTTSPRRRTATPGGCTSRMSPSRTRGHILTPRARKRRLLPPPRISLANAAKLAWPISKVDIAQNPRRLHPGRSPGHSTARPGSIFPETPM
jgi:hypothetical protein